MRNENNSEIILIIYLKQSKMVLFYFISACKMHSVYWKGDGYFGLEEPSLNFRVGYSFTGRLQSMRAFDQSMYRVMSCKETTGGHLKTKES